MSSTSQSSVINWGILLRRIKITYYLLRPLIYIILFSLIIIIINRYFINAGSINHSLILNYLQILGLPIVILLIYFLLKPYIPDVINRTEQIWGIKIRPKQPLQPDVGSGIAQESKAKDVDITNPQGRATLIQDNFEIRWLLEKSYRAAYGTQLRVLNLLTSVGPLRIENLQYLYDLHVKLSNVPLKDISTWLLYLKRDAFINESSDGLVSITDIGRLFMEYLTIEGISDPSFRNY